MIHHRRKHRVAGLTTLVVALAGTGLVLAGCSATPDPVESSPATGQGEVFLEPESDIGADPFTESVAGDITVTAAAKSPSPSSATDTGTPTTTGSPNPDTSGGLTSEVGTTPSLYGGSGDQTICDQTKLANFLTGDAAKASAWAGVLGVNVDGIPGYINSLAPVVLRSDTRVTNHGFANGQATARQSVLEAGTAVLVDNMGVPRVRCACGNPLLEPVATTVRPNYVGTQWPNFSVTLVVVVVAGPPATHLRCVDITTGKEIEVPVGSQEPTGSPSGNTASPTVTGTPSGGDTNADYTNCSRRYAELVIDLTLAGGMDPADAERWSGQAEQAATQAGSGDLAGARATICGTVAEMEERLAG